MSDQILYGGQALIEGVMMRGRRFVAAAVRDPNGNIVSTTEPISPAIYGSQWSKVPFLRAVTVLWDTLVLGTQMLLYSANVATAGMEKDDASSDGASRPVTAAKPNSTALPAGVALGTLIVSLTFGVALFFVFPLFLVSLVDPFLNAWFRGPAIASLASNVTEGIIRLAIFLGYIGLISQMPDVRRVFQYHGAEHKTIAADEAGASLTPDSIQTFSKEHPRCGTGFLLVVVIVSILVFALLGQPPILLRIASRVLLVPVVAALSYELIKFSSAHRGNPVLYWLVVKPSLVLQSLTTREPDARMIEVAVAALQKVKQEEARN